VCVCVWCVLERGGVLFPYRRGLLHQNRRRVLHQYQRGALHQYKRGALHQYRRGVLHHYRKGALHEYRRGGGRTTSVSPSRMSVRPCETYVCLSSTGSSAGSSSSGTFSSSTGMPTRMLCSSARSISPGRHARAQLGG